MPSLLTLDSVVTGYGSTPVLHGVTFEVDEGEIAVILGANGAGKTTTLRTASGLLRTWKGAIKIDGRDVTKLAAERLVGLGVGLVPAAPGVFRDLSVGDNLRVGAFGLGRDRAHAARRLDETLAQFPRLEARLGQQAGNLSGGEQRMLAIARALMAEPRLLLIDEASMGLAPTAVLHVFDLLRSIRKTGVTICMVEQSPVALDVADRALLMTKGRIVEAAQGTELEAVRAGAADVYLGTMSGGRKV